MTNLGSAFRLAAGTLTVWPAGAVGDLDTTVARNAMLLGPVAVLPLALAAGAGAWIFDALGAPDLVTGLAAVSVLALGTRALHLDGLADTADGLGSGWDRDKALAVMRRGDIGPMGVVALVIVIGLQAAAFGELARDIRGAVGLAVVICCSRAVLAVVCLRGIPAARPQGLGEAVARSVPPFAAAIVWALVLAAMAAVTFVVDGSWLTGVVATMLALVATAVLLRRCVVRLGGVTGDVMGACVEVACTALALGSVLQWPS